MDDLQLLHIIAAQINRRCPEAEFGDLFGYGAIGLMRARTNWDPSKGASFKTFASRRIYGAILDGMREMDVLTRKERKQHKRGERTFHFVSMDNPDDEDWIGRQYSIFYDPVEEIYQRELSEMLDRWIRWLPKKLRIMMEMRRMGMEPGEIAKTLQVTPGCVTTRTGEAYRLIRERLLCEPIQKRQQYRGY